MSVETHRVLIGACGWKHPSWLNDFYSDDLPEDWQLGFYSNEFPVVYVPSTDWLDADDFDDWVEDVADSFRFILEIPSSVLTDNDTFSSVLTKIKSLSEHCLGVVLLLDQSTPDDAQLLNDALMQLQGLTSVCVESKELNLSAEIQSILLKQNVSATWDGQFKEGDSAESLGLMRGDLSISHVSSENLDMPTLRKVLEICLESSNEEHTSVLCIDGEPPSLEIIRNADILLNLL